MIHRPLLTFPFLLICTLSLAQYDPEAFRILEAMSNKYKKMSSFEATLSYAMVNEMDGINEKFTGKITVQGNKFRLTLDDQEIINNGKTVWTYTPTTQEVVVDHTDTEEIDPSKFYSIYKKGYKYLYLDSEKIDGKLCDVIDLVPEDKDAQFFKIRMNIVQQDKSILNWTLFDRMGTQYRYSINKFKANVNVNDAFFIFNPKKYPDIEVIDLR